MSLLSVAVAIKCPGSGAWLGHAKTQVTAIARASCAAVKTEMLARIGGQFGWVDPHNGGIYSILSTHVGPHGWDTEIETKRTTNPKKSFGHQVYTDKQTFTLSENCVGTTRDCVCEIAACSESQGTSLKDFSTNYCDIRNLYCGSADGCNPVLNDFTSSEKEVDASSGQHDWTQCVVQPTLQLEPARPVSTTVKCPGSGAWLGHAKTQVTATAKATCADVMTEIRARSSGRDGWVDPHNGGIYSVISTSDSGIETKRTTNPKTSFGHKVYTDKQTFTLSENNGVCEIAACSESQGTSLKDFSTNYCDIRNLYCGSADGCKPLHYDFTSDEQTVDASSGQHDWSQCVVKSQSGVMEINV